MFSKKTIFLILIFCTTAFIHGCHKENNNPISVQAENTTIWPLKVGNLWSYRGTSFDSSANIIDGMDMVYYINSDSVINGQIWFRPNYYASNGEVFLKNRSDGLWVFNLTNLDSTLKLKYPALVNESYIYRGSSKDTIRITVISINDTIVTSFGSYSCYHYQFLLSNEIDVSIYNIYVAPKVGIIKENTFKKKGSGSFYMNFVSELKQFVLN